MRSNGFNHARLHNLLEGTVLLHGPRKSLLGGTNSSVIGMNLCAGAIAGIAVALVCAVALSAYVVKRTLGAKRRREAGVDGMNAKLEHSTKVGSGSFLAGQIVHEHLACRYIDSLGRICSTWVLALR